MNSTLDTEYQVTFVGDYFTMIVNVQGVEGDEDTAIDLADNIIRHQYGWSPKEFATVEIETWREWGDK